MTKSPLTIAREALERMTDEEVDKLLSAPIPGGSQARDWFLPHDTERGLANVREVVRRIIAALSAQSDEREAMTAEQKQLASFYNVKTLAELVGIQAHHIEKLQARLRSLDSLRPQIHTRVREG